MRLGLCCTFLDEDIRFRTTTARFVATKDPREARRFLTEIALDNARALAQAIAWCEAHGVGAFRISSNVFPLATHPVVGYRLEELPAWPELETLLRVAGRPGVRLSFHPDQFVVPGSLSEAVAKASLAELEHQAFVAELVGAEQLTIHGGGAPDGKTAALDRLRRALDRLSPRARERVVLENDDRIYTVEDLLPLGYPLVYDVHHHRCNPDRLDVEEATERTAATWGDREPWAHVSSPREPDGFEGAHPERHADFIRSRDVPRSWLERALTVDVEAKAKERAVLRLARALARTNGGRAASQRREEADGRTGDGDGGASREDRDARAEEGRAPRRDGGARRRRDGGRGGEPAPRQARRAEGPDDEVRADGELPGGRDAAGGAARPLAPAGVGHADVLARRRGGAR